MASSSTVKSPEKIIEEVMAKKLWKRFKYEWTQALYTPFVVSLAAGTLELDTFLHYLAQDVHILRACVQAYERAEEYADDDDAKVEICKLRKSIPEKFKLHESFQRMSIDLPKESTLDAATVKYTDFLLATASGKVEVVKSPGKLATTPFEKTKLAAYIIGAAAPRMRLYVFLGKELNAVLDPEKDIHPYQKWIDNFSSNTFQAEAIQTEELLEKLSVSLTGEELDIIEKLYHQAMKHEVEFFLGQPLVQSTLVPMCRGPNPEEHRLVLFSDFDLTCTVLDSSAILAEMTMLKAPKTDQNQSGNQSARMPSNVLRSKWEELSKLYTEEYEQCIESVLVDDKIEKSDFIGLREAIRPISVFEEKANSRVVEFEVLKGLNVEHIRRAGEHMILQDGCMDFFHSAINNENLNTHIHVISYCWCGDLIRSALSSGGLDSVSVHANELIYENSISTGGINRKIESPMDKVIVWSNILGGYSKDRKNVTVYIGDTVGDLLCLLQADIGIVIGCSSSLRRLGAHFGVSFVPLFPAVIARQRLNTSERVLHTVSSWAEIHAFILGW
ncbi:hypothetical protein BUALT_Bualt07G0050100 [Buddleja alternifolia]|uniref:Thiaminase-2/PQQC domain-containing protein n=1 Tax=Buddleja alternifolia TaxID=168488 RepID=A0AAV6X8C4_9LAMI|nr:hypothetical protein BUALT_Bualt07G0050100 [Buddleja alternifolia]